MNYYFIYGPQLIDVARQYTDLTGRPEMPPMWALGYHQCKWSYYPESKVRNICTTFREKQIPCDSIYLDIDYMDGFRCFTWNKAYFPDPHKMIRELAEDGFKTIVIIDPGIKIDPDYWVYNEAVENDYFCRRMDGALMKGKVWPGDCNFPDFTSPKVRTWWADLFKDLIGAGVKGVWNDMNEPAVFEVETMPADVRHDYDGNSCSHRKAHNIYGMQMARATYDGIKKYMLPGRPFVITRSGYSGVQRYSSVWTGDNVASWEHLAIANRQCQRLNISGITFCGSDIGGFIQMPTGELYARWIQLGIFHMFCRTHSSGDHGEQEPWSFGEEVEAIAKKYIELRYQLLPYFYTAFWQHVQDGTPVLRPLSFLDQLNSETHFRQDEFGVGDSLLVCPILQSDVEGRWTYLPEGNWYSFWTDELFEGGSEVWSEAPLDCIPVYVRAGSVIPMYPVQQYVGEKQFEELFLHVYLEKRATESVFYEDAGDGYGYQSGEHSIRKFVVSGEKQQWRLKQESSIGYKGHWNKYSLVVHGLIETPAGVECDGEYLEWSWTAERSILSLLVPQGFESIIIHV
jgi:alpha-glucosidase